MTGRVAVVGGGALGLVSATELAKSGVPVTLYEAGTPGGGASGRAAGIWYDAYAEKADAEIATRSLEYARGNDLLTACPYVWFARDEETASALESQASRMAEIGRAVEIIEPATLEERFPALYTDDMVTAAIAADAGYLDAQSYVDHLQTAAEQAGVTIRTGERARVTADEAVATKRDCLVYDRVLVAAGAHTPDVLAATNIDLALGTYRTQALVAGPVSESLPIYYDASGEYYARPSPDGILAGDGSHLYEGDPSEYDNGADKTFTDDRIDTLEDRLRTELTLDRSWAGLCTATPDRDPLLGACTDTVFVATGFCGHGLMRSPVLGRAIANEIAGTGGIDPFDPRRFDGDEPIDLPVGITD